MENQNYQGPNGNGQGPHNGNNNNNGNNGGNGSGEPPRRQSIMLFLIAALITLLGMSFFMGNIGGSSSEEITYNAFLDMVKEGKVKEVLINQGQSVKAGELLIIMEAQ